MPGGNISGVFTGNNTNDLSPNHFHGDPFAVIITATQHNVGISGIAPNCKIMPVRPTEGAAPFIVAEFFSFADTNNAKVISFGNSFAIFNDTLINFKV